MKVVFIAREPIERFWSALGMAARQAKSRIEQPLDAGVGPRFLKRKNVAAALLSRRGPMARWRKLAREGQFAISSSTICGPSRRASGALLRFLDADPALPSGDLDPGFNRKSKSAKLQLTDELRDALVDHFADEIRTVRRHARRPRRGVAQEVQPLKAPRCP